MHKCSGCVAVHELAVHTPCGRVHDGTGTAATAVDRGNSASKGETVGWLEKIATSSSCIMRLSGANHLLHRLRSTQCPSVGHPPRLSGVRLRVQEMQTVR
jgi:hypothetical protein